MAQVGLLGRVGCITLLALVAFSGCRGAASETSSFTIRLDTPAEGTASVVVEGVSRDYVARLAELTPEQWNDVFRVSIAEEQPAMLGKYIAADGVARFTPMFPLDPGRSYHVVFDASKIPGDGPSTAPVVATVALASANAQPSTVVSRVFPTADAIPENQLRMYIHFSAPMGLRGGLDYIKLLDDRGEIVEDPFLPLDAEFWNDDRTRYTVFFDPGRQKRGILPNKQMGRALLPGRRYTLVIDREWRDGAGLPLKESFRRDFRIGTADEAPLAPTQWRITAPTAGTKTPLIVTFPEPLDHGLLRRALGVSRDGQPVIGDVEIESGEMRWRFIPRDEWRPGPYALVAFGMLEDLAGNRIGRAFEVDNFERTDVTPEPERTTIPFTIVAK